MLLVPVTANTKRSEPAKPGARCVDDARPAVGDDAPATRPLDDFQQLVPALPAGLEADPAGFARHRHGDASGLAHDEGTGGDVAQGGCLGRRHGEGRDGGKDGDEWSGHDPDPW